MDSDSLADQLAALHKSLEERQSGLAQEGVGSADLERDLTSAESLADMMEELQVASEELRAQNQELIQTREQLEEEHWRYRQLFNLAPDAYLVTDPYGTITDANTMASEILQLPLRFLIGKPLMVFLDEPDRPRFRKLLLGLGRVNRLPEWEAQVRPRHGLAFPAALTVAADRTPTGEVVALRWLLRNISERKWAEQALANEQSLRNYSRQLEDLVAERTAQNEQLQRTRAQTEKLAAIGRMAARIAHEVNNPLAGIKNAFALVETAVPTNHPYYGYVERIDREIDRVAGIMRQMFDLYRPDSEVSHPFRLNQTIRDVAAMLELSCAERKVTIDVQATPGIVDGVLEGPVRHILFNLVQNAIDASGPGGQVQVTGDINPNSIVIAVADQGQGIPKEILGRIFEPFFSTKSGLERSGLGLGLPITRSMVEGAGGQIELKSEFGKGTTMRVTLPRGRAA